MTKATGVIRRVDELGRIVVPIEMRRALGIELRDPVEIHVEGSRIVICKHEPACIFCGDTAGIISYRDKNICSGCRDALKKLKPDSQGEKPEESKIEAEPESWVS